jgi:hypothetical protein
MKCLCTPARSLSLASRQLLTESDKLKLGMSLRTVLLPQAPEDKLSSVRSAHKKGTELAFRASLKTRHTCSNAVSTAVLLRVWLVSRAKISTGGYDTTLKSISSRKALS